MMCETAVEHVDHDAAALAERRHRDAEEQREHDDLQDLVAAHRVGHAGRDQVLDESLERQRAALHAGARRSRRGIGSCMLCRLERLHQDQPSVSDRSEAKMNQPSALPPTRPTVPMSPIFAMPTTGSRNQRRDDHLDQAQERERQHSTRAANAPADPENEVLTM
jgi:hypothetical protein